MNHTAVFRSGPVLLAAVFLGVAPAHALIELDHAVLILSGEATASYDSNILARSGAPSDTILSFSPSLEYRRDSGRGKIDFTAGASFMSYLDHSDRNHSDYNFGGSITAPVSPDSPFSGAFNAGYSDATQVNESVGDLVATKTTNLGGSAGYAFSERLRATAGANYSNTENKNYGNNDTTGFNLGLSFQEFLFRRLPLRITYGYTSTKSTDDATAARRLDTTSQSLSVGTGGQISAKVTGDLSFGVRSTDDKGTGFSSSNSNNNGFVASSSLAWAADELTKVSLSLSKSLAVTPNNASTDTTSLALGLSRKLSEQMSANAAVSQSWNSYREISREDRVFGINAGLSYQIRRHWSAAANYRFSNSTSDLSVSNFDRHVVSFSVTGSF